MADQVRRVSRRIAAIAASAAFAGLSPARAQTAKEPDRRAIVVTGERQSAIKLIQPIATLDPDAIAATGATSMAELLRAIQPLTQSADGEDPIFLLNGQRTSGYQEIGSLPPEAIDKVEILPEPAALKFGYPPTRRVLNFITKRAFRQVEVKATLGTTTNPGSTIANGNFNLTRLHNDQRFTLALESRHTSSIYQSERELVPDPEVLFDSIGNITGLNGGEIDPALSAAAGQPVTVAPVPADPSSRSSLGAYAIAANQPRIFDPGPYRTILPHNDAWKVESVLADKLGGTLSGSLNLTAEKSTDSRILGPASATLTVPSSNPFSPFSNTVLLQRVLTEAPSLKVRLTTITLHGGGTLRGVTAGWRWDLTGSVDQKLTTGKSENGIDVTAANAAIAGGADPFAPLASSLVADRLVDRGHLLTRTMGTKLVVTNTPFALPAGEVTVTGTAEAERMTTNSVTRGANPFDLSLGRTRTEAGVSLDIPISSRRDNVLAAIGDLSANASIFARHVSGFGSLADRTLGVTWGPIKGVQLLVQDKSSGTAPEMDKLASPIIVVPNAAIFDYATGRTEIVTLTRGGNPDLLAERKHVRSFGVNVKPFAGDVRFSATYELTDIRNQVGDIYADTPLVEGIFPDLFVRDPSGRLIAETFQPTNFTLHRQRSLNMTLSASGAIGKKQTPKPGSQATGDGRAHFYAGAGPIVRFTDQLLLRPGAPVLNLLDGDSITGSGTPRVTGYFYSGIGYLGNDLNIGGWYQSGQRVRSDVPASDLFFSPIFKLNVRFAISVHHFLRKEDWTRHLQVSIDVENVTDAHIHVHDRDGNVPNRFQPDFLDPIGRTVNLMVRKLF